MVWFGASVVPIGQAWPAGAEPGLPLICNGAIADGRQEICAYFIM